MRYFASLNVLVLLLVGNVALAQTTVPHIFTPGTPARATEVNQNFQALATAIDGVAARLAKFEGTAPVTDSDIVGTYHYSNLQIGTVWTGTNATHVEAITYEGTFVFAADHTFSAVFTGKQNDNNGPLADDGQLEGTWSLSGGVLSASTPGSAPIALNCALACRLMVTTLEGSAAMVGDDAHNNLVILVRID